MEARHLIMVSPIGIAQRVMGLTTDWMISVHSLTRSPPCSDMLLGPSSFLSNGYWRVFSCG